MATSRFNHELKTLADYRQVLTTYQTDARERFLHGADVVELVHERAEVIDELLRHLWQVHQLNQQPDLALIAVGGYGRGELHPYSDVDILLLHQQPLSHEIESQVSAFITQLWDLNLQVGHAVRSVQQCIEVAQDDITIATNLVEMRLLCGSEASVGELQHLMSDDDFWPSEAFFTAKREEQRARHRQYHGNTYNLEPDLKANPGGLRDIQTIGWVAKHHFGVGSLYELISYGFLTQAEYQELQDCQYLLWQMRYALHLETKRADNRLLFDRQLAVATALGYPGSGNKAIEAMMKSFYRTIRRVIELNEMLLQWFDEQILGNNRYDITKLDEHFQIRGQLIEATSPLIVNQQPDNILQLFLHIAQQKQIVGIHSSTLRRLREARRRLTHWLKDYARCRAIFMQLLRHRRGMGLAFTLMHRHGVLEAYLPQWAKIVGLMQFDLFHAYTVDEHTHRVVKNVNAFFAKDSLKNFPVAADLVKRLDKPELLYLGAIFHDIAKGRGGDHSQLGAEDAQQFCQLHGLDHDDTNLVCRLVEQHLVMSVTAQRRDISDPRVVTEFARVVGDRRYLNYLYCLTVADICATNDETWNSWKDSLLRELYTQTDRALRRGFQRPLSIRAHIRRHQRFARETLHARGFSPEDVTGCWRQLRADYFMRLNPTQIAWHTDNILCCGRTGRPLVLISPNTSRGASEIFIYCPDRQGLFALLAGEIGSKNMNIVDAQIFTTRDGYALDTFTVLEQDGSSLSAERARILREDLFSALTNVNYRQQPVRKMSRQLRQFTVAPQVNYLDSKGNRTQLELVALDAPGLLGQVARVFEQTGVVLNNARITTIGERAEDFFIITNAEGGKLSRTQERQLSQKLILALENQAG